jgi:hypothetical protein
MTPCSPASEVSEEQIASSGTKREPSNQQDKDICLKKATKNT